MTGHIKIIMASALPEKVSRAGADSLLKSSEGRRVRARGLHDFPGNHGFCRPGALTGRAFQPSPKP
jgi:hypothetical protein